MRDFYDHQENAYERTGRLILLLSVAILGTVLSTGLVLAYLVVVAASLLDLTTPLGVVFLISFVMASALSAIVVLIGSLWKLAKLRAGGAVIAMDLGGTLVEPGSTDLNRRKILNVVEEMAIASGVPIPPVYIMELEEGINAFAAGFSPHDAIIAVTQGSVRRLSRDQLQGVVAHEFSHILNGDMRMNLRTIGVLYGVLAITICAERMIYEGLELMERPSDDGDTTFVGVGLVIVGAAIWPVGLIGVFFGVLIQAAINRQREYLADASAVEFTRNPTGIAGALKVIGGYDRGSRVRSPKAVEASHLFFAQGYGLARWLASHPSLEVRIRRLDPEWDGVPIFESEETIQPYQGAFEETMNFVGGKTQSSAPAHWADEVDDSVDEEEEEVAWRLTDRHLSDVATSMSSELVTLATESDAACAMLFALWLASHDDSVEVDGLPSEFRETAVALLPILQPLDPAQRLLLFDTSLAALRDSDSAARKRFGAAVEQLLATPSQRNPFQRMWSQVVRGQFRTERPKPRFGSLADVQHDCAVLLSALVYAGEEVGMAALYTFQRGAVHLELSNPELLFPEACGLQEVEEALDRISQVAPSGQRKLSLACGACVTSDREVTIDEALLLRGIYAELNLPNPGVLPGQPVLPGA